ncbi:MAG: EVE domain-containing protein [Candidatus Sericytochromatia bacterium]
MSNTKYWVIVASKEHVQKGVREGFAQACHGKSAQLKKIKKGDYVLFYSSKDFFDKPDKCQKFTAIGQAKDDLVYQFQMSENFVPHRKDINFLESKEVSILPLINDLDFIENKKSWGYPFRWGFFEIKEKDFNLISSNMIIN